jgi:hypothetical protein
MLTFLVLRGRPPLRPVAKFIVLDWGDMNDSGIGLTLSSLSGTMNLATGYTQRGFCRLEEQRAEDVDN